VRPAIAGGSAVAVLLTLALGVGNAAAPGPAQKTPVFGVGLDVIEVTVTVRDGKGALVGDLKADDSPSAPAAPPR